MLEEGHVYPGELGVDEHELDEVREHMQERVDTVRAAEPHARQRQPARICHRKMCEECARCERAVLHAQRHLRARPMRWRPAAHTELVAPDLAGGVRHALQAEGHNGNELEVEKYGYGICASCSAASGSRR